MMDPNTRADLRHAVWLAVLYWPNSHLGDLSPREDIRGAFRLIRSRLRAGEHIQSAIGALETSAYRHAYM